MQKLGWLAPFLIPANTEMPPRASTISGPAPDLSACSQREVHPACKIRPLPHDSWVLENISLLPLPSEHPLPQNRKLPVVFQTPCSDSCLCSFKHMLPSLFRICFALTYVDKCYPSRLISNIFFSWPTLIFNQSPSKSGGWSKPSCKSHSKYFYSDSSGLLSEERIKKMWYIVIMEYYSAKKRTK